MVARRFIVKGHVQGVGFRYYAIREARRVGVTGTVRNLADGSVEAIAEGSFFGVSEFRAALERGPSYGLVDLVVETEMPLAGYSRFDVAF